MYEIYGRYYESLKEICEEYELSINNLRHYIKSHGESSIEDYIKRHNILVNGKKFNSLSKACIFYDVKYNSVYEKIKRKGISIEDAINSILKNKRNNKVIVEIDGEEIKGIKELANRLKVNERTVSKYVKKYEDIEQAIEFIKRDVIEAREKRKESYHIFGKRFKNKKEIASFYNISYTSINKSKNIKETVKELVYEKDILEEHGELKIIKINNIICFTLEQELEKVLLYRDFDSKFLEERKLEIF